MIIKSSNLEDFFIEKVDNLPGREDTKAYIISILTKYKSSKNDLSQEILTLTYAKARETGNFEIYQNLADWIFFVKSIYPQSLKNATEDYYFSMAQSSYYKCYLMINKSWVLFEELADQLPTFITHLNDELTL